MKDKILFMVFIASIFLFGMSFIFAEEITYCEDNPNLDCVCKEGIRQIFTCPSGETCINQPSFICVSGEYIKGEIIVRFNDDVSLEEANQLIESYNLTWAIGSPITTYGPLRGYVIIEKGKEQEWIITLERSEIVKYSSPNPINSITNEDNQEDNCPTDAPGVCGIDGDTYPNSCVAGKSGVEVVCEGPCPCKDTEPIPNHQINSNNLFYWVLRASVAS